ncbi:KEOPS complex subunit Pcc1 [Halalkalicoccus sp. NIPERK01]|uniref:KEOPS complex subunit Pcc1 n=1 Tax=Halalkalicoccus sp. NIPERK01 TaxID=3053469 RepID=UPI00256E9EA9|nr:KEOPS complex subunit Pcc1 [Halalkalicoccus sp. NIPERK01]
MTVHDAYIRFEYPDQRRARLVERSIRPELDDLADERSSAAVSRDGATLSVRIGAEDLVALRAATNTWLTLLEVAERAADAGDRVDS